MSNLLRLSLASLASLGLASAAFAAGPNLTGAASLSPTSVAVGSASRFTARMCNVGDRTATNAYLSTMLPSVGYSIVAQPRGGSCRAVRYGSSYYLYCMVTLRPGACGDLVLNVTPSVAGEYAFNAYADMNNLLRESDETDNTGTATLTAY